MSLTLAVALIAISSVIFFLYPWLRRETLDEVSGEDSRIQANVALFKEQQAHYQLQLSRGEIDHEEQERLVSEAKQLLLNDTKERRADINIRKGSWLFPLLMIAVPLVSLWIYQGVGASADEEIAGMMVERNRLIEAASPISTLDRDLFRAIEKRVVQRPENAYYWTMLAQFSLEQGNLKKSVEYFARAVELAPNDSYLLAQYAQTLFFADGNQFTEPVRMAVDRAFAADSSNQTTLGLKGIEAFEVGEYRLAIRYWERARQGLQPSSAAWQALQSGIDRAQASLGEEWVAPTISVQLNLDSTVSFTPDQSVFVAVVDAQGSPMPLAAKKMTAGQLPTTVSISDGDAMIAGRSLSSASQVRVIARLSISGSATPQVGDWEAISEAIELEAGNTEVNLTINQRRE